MPLNPSGPISLGGSTVGQSINLELGQSATALASINSTQFRTLAGVPSGTIALSNFYGKSNDSSWILCFGYTTICYPSQISTGAQEGTFIGNAGWDVSPNGLMAIPMAGPLQPGYSHRALAVRWVDKTGTTTGSIKINPVASGNSNQVRAILPTFQGSSTYYTTIESFYLYQNPILFGATSSNTYQWATWKQVYAYDSRSQTGSSGLPVATDSSGRFFIRCRDNGKAGESTQSSRMSADGASATSLSYYWGAPVNAVVTRSDGVIIGCGWNGATQPGYYASSFYTFPSSYSNSNVLSTILYTWSNSDFGFAYTTFDNVNNITWTYGSTGTGNNRQGSILRVASDGTPTTYVSYIETLTGFGMFANQLTFDGGLSYSNGSLYMAAFNTSTQRIYFAKINPTTLAPIWCVSLEFSNASGTPQNISQSNYYGVYAPLIKASSTAVHAVFTINSPGGSTVDGGSGYALKILSSGISPGTYSVPANSATYTLVVRSVTLTQTSRTLPSYSNSPRNLNGLTSPNTSDIGTSLFTSTPAVNPTLQII